MAVHVLDAMAREGFEEVIAIHDHDSGLRALLALHDTTWGPAFGGIRRFGYRDERTGLVDCLRLARAMAHKCALAGVAGGGAKMVVFDADGLDLAAAYRAIGRRIERLAGRYYAGPDVGTGWDQLAYVAEETAYVTREGPAGPGDLGGATAAGVFAGMRAALTALDGEPDWSRRSIVIQGLGTVGSALAGRLRAQGARVLGSDVNVERVERARWELGVEALETGSELGVEADVFSPCAMGGILHDLSVERLRARVVCGAANNPLARTKHGDSLHRRGILLVPDIVANAGAVLMGACFHLSGKRLSLEEIEGKIEAVVTDVLRESSQEGTSPFRVAQGKAERILRERREQLRPSPVGPPSESGSTA